MTPKVRIVAEGLAFPEGPVAMEDGTVLVTEMRTGTLSRVTSDGRHSVVAQLEGVPNGATIGPDGACYVANSGGANWHDLPGVGRVVAHGVPAGYTGGWIERVNLATGKAERVCESVNGIRLRGPNDLCFDRAGGLWFTDFGKMVGRTMDVGAVHYLEPGLNSVREAIYPSIRPNGVGLSPDEKQLYMAETTTARLWSFDLESPGRIIRQPWPMPNGGRVLGGIVGYSLFDSLAVDSAGHIWVATLFAKPGVTEFAPDGRIVSHVPIDDPYVTNVCFGGRDLRTAFVTCSSTGRLVAFEAPRPGMATPFH